MNDDRREGGLLSWQRSGYAGFHGDRRNLLLHAATVPLFWAGTLTLLASPLGSVWLAPSGIVACLVAVVAQGAGHGREARPPLPFRGPLDAVLRIVAEQWITFPRFVLDGGFARAWRG